MKTATYPQPEFRKKISSLILFCAGILTTQGQVRLAAGRMHSITVCINDGGKVIAWGGNDQGQVGDSTLTDRSFPVQSRFYVDGWKPSAGRHHSALIKNDSTLWVWGMNDNGQLGDSTLTDRRAPVRVNAIRSAHQVVAMRYSTCVLLADSTVWCWGLNDNGQLGDSTFTDRNFPVKVKGGNKFISIGGSYNHMLAIRADSTVMAWGSNAAGELGDGTTTNRNYPVSVTGLDDVVQVTGGREFSLALKSDGTVWSWGESDDGRLGQNCSNKGSDQLSPVQVLNLSAITKISCGEYHGLARKSDGTIWSWGDNARRAIGDGTASDKFCPVRVLDITGAPGSYLTGISDIECGFYHNLALGNDGTVYAWGENSEGNCGQGYFGADLDYPAIVNAGCTSMPLPLNFSWFQLKKNEDELPQLLWAISDGEDFHHFEIMRGPDQRASQLLGTLMGNASSTTSGYEFTDLHPLPGANFYRIRAVDHDGNVVYSELKSFYQELTPSAGLSMEVWPNPSSGQVQVRILAGSEQSQTPSLKILNLSGSVLREFTPGTLENGYLEFSQDFHDLAPGMYFLLAESGSNKASFKLIRE